MRKKVFIIESEPKKLGELRKKTLRFLKEGGSETSAISGILVALGEGCTNSIRHAYAEEKGFKIQVTLLDGSQKTIVKIRDYGRKFDPSKIKSPKLPPTQPHGLGIHVMKSIMDECRYVTTHRVGNELILVKYKAQRKARR